MCKTFVSRIHKIDTGILTGCAGMHSFDQLYGLHIIEVLEPDLEIERIANLANNGIDFETYIDKEVLLSKEIEKILFEKNMI